MGQAAMTNDSARVKIHDRDTRGLTNAGWLKSRHSFSFGRFYDPARMGAGPLRVMNEDVVAPGAGFGTHPHDNMEIISCVLKGALEHKDSMGTGSVIKTGDIQKMSAGSGVSHSEFNHSPDEPVHFYQIWIVPDQENIAPSYEQISLDPAEFSEGFVLVGGGREGSDKTVSIQQDAKFLIAMPKEGTELTYSFKPSRKGFLQVVRGQVTLEGETLKEGDGAELSDAGEICITALTDAEIFLFEFA